MVRRIYLILLIMSLLFLTGCGKDLTYYENYKNNLQKSNLLCESKDMDLEDFYPINNEHVKVICYTQSPLRYYNYGYVLEN